MNATLMAPRPTATRADLDKWYEAKQNLDGWKAEEARLRILCADTFIPVDERKEGVNNLPIDNGFVLKVEHTLNRKLNEAEYEANRVEFKKLGIPRDIVVDLPEFKLKPYRMLTPVQVEAFDVCLIVTPGMPQMSIVKPKRA